MERAVHPFPSTIDKPKSEMTDEELRQHEQDEFALGPFRLLTAATTTGAPLLIHLRNDHRLVARVRAFDRHCNMVLEGVREFWREGGGAKGRGVKRRKGVERERHVNKMFLRGDSVILVVQPKTAA